jgi:hypothetical protein
MEQEAACLREKLASCGTEGGKVLKNCCLVLNHSMNCRAIKPAIRRQQARNSVQRVATKVFCKDTACNLCQYDIPFKRMH